MSDIPEQKRINIELGDTNTVDSSKNKYQDGMD